MHLFVCRVLLVIELQVPVIIRPSMGSRFTWAGREIHILRTTPSTGCTARIWQLTHTHSHIHTLALNPLTAVVTEVR